MRNIEAKASLRDRESALEACRRMNARTEGDIRQTDTYFVVPKGRLKLRESDPGPDYLVCYERPDVAQAKGCDYTIALVDAPVGDVLRQALGVLAVVEKVRTLYLWENVRIHLDRVRNLGDFIEFEAVLDATHDDADGFWKLTWLQEQFGIDSADWIEGSYLDLILAARKGQS